jgi:Uma2 family endonuclease
MIAELISADQYLHTSFEHDAEFVEGRIVERPLPTWEHSSVQEYLIRAIYETVHSSGFIARAELRVQTRRDRYRVPDVTVVTEKPSGAFGRRIITDPPFLCVEILSPEDTAVDTLSKVAEYLAFGVQWVWVIDPVSCSGQIHSATQVFTVSNKVFTAGQISVDLSAVEF